MKKTLWTLLLAVSLSGCSTIQVSQDYDTNTDFSQLKTFAWLPAADQVKPTAEEFEKKNPLIAERIQKAVLTNMKAKGYQFVSQQPNAYITYHVGVSSKIRSIPVTTSIGFGTGFYGGYGGLGVQTGSDIEEYQQGKVVLDILDSNKKLVWRGISTSDVEQHASPEEITKQVNEIVEKLLAQYPPKTAK